MNKAYAILNGQVIDPASGINQKMDILIKDGKIACLSERLEQNILSDSSIEQIDATGLIVCPGLVDLCHHLREPGQKHKGTIASETYAAITAGVTSLCCPPNTSPIIDNTAVVKLIRVGAEEADYINVYMMGAMTKGLEGKQLSEMLALTNSGCVGVSNSIFPIADTLVMRRAMEYAASHNINVFLYPRDHCLSKNTCAHDGAVSARLGLTGEPECSETIALLRDIELIELTGVKAHFCHISSAKGVDIIRQAKKRGLAITADVTINHLHLTEMDIGFFQSDCHSIPPFRTQRDKEALLAGLMDNTIDAIVSDHQPHDNDAKLAPFAETEPGLSGIETFLSLALKLADTNPLSMSKILSKMTNRPAEILSIAAGTISENSEADICLFDPEHFWSVDKNKLFSAGKNTPYHGWELASKVKYTFIKGKCVYQYTEM